MKTKRIMSGAPLIALGVLTIVYAALFGLHTFLSYVGAALLCFLLLAPLRRYFPDRFMVVELPPNTGNIACDQLIVEARGVIRNIHEARARIPTDSIDKKVDLIEALARQMLAALAKQPELQGQLRIFLRYYLPTTHKLVDARAQIVQAGARGDAAERTAARIEQALEAIRRAFEKQLDAVDHFQYLNVETEIEVLRDLLQKDGLLKDGLLNEANQDEANQDEANQDEADQEKP